MQGSCFYRTRWAALRSRRHLVTRFYRERNIRETLAIGTKLSVEQQSKFHCPAGPPNTTIHIAPHHERTFHATRYVEVIQRFGRHRVLTAICPPTSGRAH